MNEGGAVQIGDDCLIAAGADLRNSDGHTLLAGDTGERINPAADIRLEDHVWLGVHTQILKGVRIGTGAVVAARAVVTGDIPPHALAAGVPARILRTGIRWNHRRL